MVSVVNSPCSLLLLREIEGLEDAILRIQRAMEQLINEEQAASLSTLVLTLVVKGVELFSIIPQVKKELSHHPDDKDKDIEDIIKEEEDDYEDDEYEEDDLFLQTTWGLGNNTLTPILNEGGHNEGDDKGLSDSEEEVNQRTEDKKCKNNTAFSFKGDGDAGYGLKKDADEDEDYSPAEDDMDDDDDYYDSDSTDSDADPTIGTKNKRIRSRNTSKGHQSAEQDYEEVPLIQRIAQLISKQKEGKDHQKNAEKDSCDGSTCPVCQKQFTESRCMKVHLNLMHLRNLRSRKITGEEELSSLQEYLESLTTPPFNCPVCIPLEFEEVRGIRKHLGIFHLENEGRVKLNFPVEDHPCEHCQKTFRNRRYLIQHMKLMHQQSRLHLKVEEGEELFQTLKTWVVQNVETGGDDPRCPVCGVECIRWHKRERHVLKYHFQQGEEKKILSRYYLEEDSSKSSSKRSMFPCNVCGKPCPSLDQAKIHADTHHHPQGILCPTEGCGKRFLGLAKYMIHIKCHKEGPVRSNTKTNDSSQALTCPYPNCGKRFSHSAPSQLKIHLRSHTKPYICSTCGKGLITAYDLKRHEYALHNPDCRTYQCQQCPKVLKNTYSLKIHMEALHNKERENFLCPHCGKLLASKTILNRHVKSVHLQLRPHKCHLCPKAFKSRGHLAYHVKTHENPGGKQRGLNRPKDC